MHILKINDARLPFLYPVDLFPTICQNFTALQKKQPYIKVPLNV
jgi:hypothetical protein